MLSHFPRRPAPGTQLPRRAVLAGAAAGAALSSALGSACSREPPVEMWISAEGNEHTGFGLGATAVHGEHFKVAVGQRGHDVLQHPLQPHKVLFVARHPGHQLVVIDLDQRAVVQSVTAAPNAVFNGHACFSADGQVVFTTESDVERGAGRLVARDSASLRVLGEFPSHGVGPHELQLMPDGHTLAVANGGLLTHPSTGRTVLNLETMASRLSFVDSRSGELLGEYGVDEQRASIRHLDVAPDGSVAVALQLQGEVMTASSVPLAALYRPDSAIQVLTGPAPLMERCRNYMGSTRINSAAGVVGFTSPRGDIALFWDLRSAAFLGYHRFHDVCGITASVDARHFVLSNSAGQLRQLDANSLEREEDAASGPPDYRWDNHLHAIQFST